MSTVYLHGGGIDPESSGQTFGRILEAVRGPGRLVLVVAEADEEEAAATDRAYRAVFGDLGLAATDMLTLFVTPERPLQRAMLDAVQPGALFVCGGATPFYHRSLCLQPAWTDCLRERDVVYAGTSAGSAIASRHAILGGWLAPTDPVARQILFRGANEGLERLAVAPGLGLVPFAIDVHASQWGTLSRLVHAVASGLVDDGWAIDENTMLEVGPDSVAVHGQGHAYRVRRNRPAVAVTIYVAPEVIPLVG